jgi:hypothetical protein
LLHTITPLYLSSSLPLVSLFPSLQQVPNTCYSRFFHPLLTKRRQVSSGSIVSDYGLDDWVTGVRSQRIKGFYLHLLCPDRLWDPPSLLYNGYWGSFPRGKARLGRDADHSPPSSAEVVNE